MVYRSRKSSSGYPNAGRAKGLFQTKRTDTILGPLERHSKFGFVSSPFGSTTMLGEMEHTLSSYPDCRCGRAHSPFGSQKDPKNGRGADARVLVSIDREQTRKSCQSSSLDTSFAGSRILSLFWEAHPVEFPLDSLILSL